MSRHVVTPAVVVGRPGRSLAGAERDARDAVMALVEQCVFDGVPRARILRALFRVCASSAKAAFA